VRLIGTPCDLVRNPLREIVGRRLSDVFSGLWRSSPALFAAMVRVVETGEPADIEVPAEAGGVDFCSRNIVARLGDGIAAWTMDETERKRSQEALREADRRKDVFVATLAHELRNPLAPIRQAAAISRMPSATEAQLRWSHEVIERQVQRMSLLLDDLLDISRITRGRLELRKTTVYLTSVIDAAVEPVQPLIEECRHRLTVIRPEANLRIEADPLRLSQVLSNLLTNAAKYTDPGGSIDLTAQEEEGEVVIRVADSGIGISAEAMPRIFEMFSQVRSAMARSVGGLGIGLALSRGLVELHGGSIAVHSDGPGRGSQFTIRLPTGAAASQADAASSRPAQRPLVPRCRVLVADDNRDAADSLAMLIELHGCDLRTAFDGEQALATAASFRPQLALLDIGMPKLNGYEVAARLREQPWGGSMTLIAVTGWGQEEDKRRSAAAGFDHHLTKPIDPAALGSLLTRVRSS
jgi:signal transduction histidine kinase/CheY-like chemotaxis protein